ncbi:MAG: hypothetical protein KDF58_00570 [Alphaproteobacteria bacterium]|nr:hypothetical protein [Alphaproteobacteria bacterium]HPF46488.1 ATP-binding protein [Emcibacteraceae bacterium]
MINVATLASVSSAFYAILFILLSIFWWQNKDIDGIIWWCAFPLFRLVYSVIGSDSVNYEDQFFIYVGNLAAVLSDTFLLIGCLKFIGQPINWKLIGGYLILFVLICCYQYSINAELPERTKLVVVFDLIPIISSIMVLFRLPNTKYALEKYFTIFWVSMQIAVFSFWILINFEFNNRDYGIYILFSLTFIYVSHIFTTVGLIILTIARRRSQLREESRDHKLLEEELEKTLRKAQDANDEKTKFLTNMSHELRTPLNAIIGFSESLKLSYYGELNPKQREYVDNIHGGGELLLKLITDLLDLSSIEEGKMDILLEEVNLNLLIEKTLPLLREIVGAESDRLKIHNEISDSKKSCAVYIDQIRTKQILINFVSNAVKYGNPDSDVILTISDHDEHYFRVSVKDSGRGIAPEQYENIFKPFNRAGNEKSNIEGIGVGLSIARKLIHEMQGNIDFISTVGEGSEFWIDIPKSKQHQLPIS